MRKGLDEISESARREVCNALGVPFQHADMVTLEYQGDPFEPTRIIVEIIDYSRYLDGPVERFLYADNLAGIWPWREARLKADHLETLGYRVTLVAEVEARSRLLNMEIAGPSLSFLERGRIDDNMDGRQWPATLDARYGGESLGERLKGKVLAARDQTGVTR